MPTDPETRRKGAHFLTNSPDVVARIVAAAEVQPGESVLDVGSGPGAITRLLSEKVGPAGAVLAVENDPVWAAELRRSEIPHVRVVESDALAVRLPKRIDAVVANPPFRILPGLLRRLLDHGFGRAILVAPEEFVARLTAKPGDEAYGKLTIQIGARAKSKVVFPLRRKDFDPVPDVPCLLLQVVPKPAMECDWDLLDTVLEAAWAAKQKTLRHSLAPLAQQLGVPPLTITQALQQTNAGPRPATEVSAWEFVQLTQAIARELVARKAE